MRQLICRRLCVAPRGLGKVSRDLFRVLICAGRDARRRLSLDTFATGFCDGVFFGRREVETHNIFIVFGLQAVAKIDGDSV